MIRTILAFLFVVFITCPATAQTIEQSILLKSGFNFVSFTVIPEITPSQLKQNNSLLIEDIYLYSAAAGSFLSNSEGTLTSLGAGKGYIIKTLSAGTITISGNAVTSVTDISLKTGFNLIGISQTISTNTFSGLMKKFGIIKGLYKWSSAAGTFIQVVMDTAGTPQLLDGADPQFKAGESYFINVYDNTVLSFSGGAISLVGGTIPVVSAASVVITGACPALAAPISAPGYMSDYGAIYEMGVCDVSTMTEISGSSVVVSGTTYTANVPADTTNMTALVVIKHKSTGKIIYSALVGVLPTVDAMATVPKITVSGVNLTGESTALATIAKDKGLAAPSVPLSSTVTTMTASVKSAVDTAVGTATLNAITNAVCAVQAVLNSSSVSENTKTLVLATVDSTIAGVLKPFIVAVKDVSAVVNIAIGSTTVTIGGQTIGAASTMTDVNTAVTGVVVVTITTVTNPADITVASGTAVSAITFPTTVSVTKSNGTTDTVSVVWSTTAVPVYVATTSGAYVFTGTVSGTTLTAKVNVIVGAAAQTVATPTFTPEAGNFTAAQSVTIACATTGASIYYTTDGTTPTASSTAYTTAIPVAATTMIKAIAVKTGMTNSAVAQSIYTINISNIPVISNLKATKKSDGSLSVTWNTNLSLNVKARIILINQYIGASYDPTSAVTRDETITLASNTHSIIFERAVVPGTFAAIRISYIIGEGGTSADLPFSSITIEPQEGGQTLNIDLGSGMTLEMVKISAAGKSFQMGSPTNEADRLDAEGPVHTVSFTKDYYIGKYEVTQAQWVKIYGGWPGYAPSDVRGLGNNYPAYNVSWYDICYTGGFLDRINSLKPSGYSGFRLPTEAEWEYAARGGTQTAFYWGNDASYNSVGNYAWYKNNSSSKTQPVGQKTPNAFGLYDMTGNVWEWCGDWFAFYGSSAVIDPTGPSFGEWPILRGGSWNDEAGICRTAYRGNNYPNSRYTNNGFRLALPVDQTAVEQKVQTPTFSPNGTTFNAFSQTVVIACGTLGATIRYTTDGSTPTSTTGNIYIGPIYVFSTTTIKAIAIRSGMLDSNVASATYTKMEKVATPEISPNGGLITPPQNFTISSATSGAIIKYTTDGSDPSSTNGITYSGPISLLMSGTVKAIAIKSGMIDSDVSSAYFVINRVLSNISLIPNTATVDPGEMIVMSKINAKLDYSDLTTMTINAIKLKFSIKSGTGQFSESGNFVAPAQPGTTILTATVTEEGITKTVDLLIKINDPNNSNNYENYAIETNIDGAFNGWSGQTTFKLANGQIWKQSKDGVKYASLFNPKVTIYKVLFGYKMKVDGVDDTVFVERIDSLYYCGEYAIETTIDGEFGGWTGDTVFNLSNGQVWQQGEYGSKYTAGKYRPDVTIYRTRAGYKMRVDGILWFDTVLIVNRIR